MDRLIAVVRAANHGVLAGSIRGVANLDGGMMEVDRVCFLESVLGLSRCLVLVMVLANGYTDAWLMHRRMSTASVASGIGKMLWYDICRDKNALKSGTKVGMRKAGEWKWQLRCALTLS